MTSLTDKLAVARQRSGSTLCVGLDPDPAKYPGRWRGRADHTAEFCKAIVDATADLVCAFKPQIAYFSAIGAEQALSEVIAHIRHVAPDVPVILDAKRGDIGPTAEQYAREAFDRYAADAVTVNPYLGFDTIEPFLAHSEGAVFALCKTSNPGSADIQGLPIEGQPLYRYVAHELDVRFGGAGNLGLVAGATYPEELADIRAIVGHRMPLLIPGVGAQGADASATARAGGEAIVVNSSRAVLYAGSTIEDFAGAARAVAARTVEELRVV